MPKSPPSEPGQLPLFEFDAENLEKVERHQPVTQLGESHYSKYIVYVDESGDHSLQVSTSSIRCLRSPFTFSTKDTTARSSSLR